MMRATGPAAALAIDLTRLHRRAVTSFYSNLVTRPTGRAVRMGVEQQLVELTAARRPFLSILDFSQVRVLDYSCADEIVAKLLLRYLEVERPGEVYFLARGLQEHHLESVEAVLERHELLLAVEGAGGRASLVGAVSEVELRCWEVLVERGSLAAAALPQATGVGSDAARTALNRFLLARVAAPLAGEMVCPVSRLAHG